MSSRSSYNLTFMTGRRFLTYAMHLVISCSFPHVKVQTSQKTEKRARGGGRSQVLQIRVLGGEINESREEKKEGWCYDGMMGPSRAR